MRLTRPAEEKEAKKRPILKQAKEMSKNPHSKLLKDDILICNSKPSAPRKQDEILNNVSTLLSQYDNSTLLFEIIE